MKISIVGLGWLGSELARVLKKKHEVSGTTRRDEKAQVFRNEGIVCETLNPPQVPSTELMDADVLVVNIPPFSGQLAWIQSWNLNAHTHVIFISSTSVYGQEEGLLNESVDPAPVTENGVLLVSEETWIRSLPRHTIIRCGGLTGLARHPGKILSGRKNLSGGNQPVNLIHLDDVIGFIKLVIDEKKTGEVYNLVSPLHPTRRDYYQGYCLSHQLPLPEFDDSVEAGKTVDSHKAQQIYRFTKPDCV